MTDPSPNAPNAARFIVTLYGDIVEPRGGVLWMGSLIELCASVGISESLARTAVSRLVSAEQLVGDRVGRRSYYRLTGGAATSFAQASRLIFGGAPSPTKFFLVHSRDPDHVALLLRAGCGRISADHFVGVEDFAHLPGEFTQFKLDHGQADLHSWAEGIWPIEPHASAYRGFISEFETISSAGLDPKAALANRLLLIHRFRLILLGEPRLPARARPIGWPGDVARRVFAAQYLALSPGAQTAIQDLRCRKGPLPQGRSSLDARERWMRASLKS